MVTSNRRQSNIYKTRLNAIIKKLDMIKKHFHPQSFQYHKWPSQPKGRIWRRVGHVTDKTGNLHWPRKTKMPCGSAVPWVWTTHCLRKHAVVVLHHWFRFAWSPWTHTGAVARCDIGNGSDGREFLQFSEWLTETPDGDGSVRACMAKLWEIADKRRCPIAGYKAIAGRKP